MKRTIDNVYLRELECRQNQNITTAQLHLYKNARRYSDIEIGECFKEMKEKKQVNLDREKIKESDTTATNRQEKYEEELENKIIERLFIYHSRLIMIDDKDMLRLKHKSDLFDEFIYEFTKLYNWLDNRGAYLKFTDNSEKEYVIDRSEIATVIHFFDKLNKIKKD